MQTENGMFRPLPSMLQDCLLAGDLPIFIFSGIYKFKGEALERNEDIMACHFYPVQAVHARGYHKCNAEHSKVIDTRRCAAQMQSQEGSRCVSPYIRGAKERGDIGARSCRRYIFRHVLPRRPFCRYTWAGGVCEPGI